MNHYFDFVENAVSGKPLPGATVSVLKADGSLATLASDPGGTPLANPVTTDKQGNYSFYVDDGTYTLSISYGPTQLDLIENVRIVTGLDAAAARAAAVENAIGSSQEKAPSQAAVAAAFDQVADPTAGADRVGYAGRTVRQFLNDLANVRRFGAVGDGIADDTAAIQAAIDFAATKGGAVYFPDGTYKLTLRLAQSGGGVIALSLPSKVELIGASQNGAVLKLANNQIGPGTFLRIISTNGRSNRCVIRNLTIDGNRQGQGMWAAQGNGGNVIISADEAVVENVTSVNANGQCIQIVGGPTDPISFVRVVNCRASSTGGSSLNSDGSVSAEFNGNGIGIQISHAQAYTIAGNTVSNTKDNCIDVYNDRGAGAPTGGECLITGNNVREGRVGIFPETTSRALIIGNIIQNMTEYGIVLNRIASTTSRLKVADNLILGGQIGIRCIGDSSPPGIVLEDNQIVDYSFAGVELFQTSYVGVVGNTFSSPNAAAPAVRVAGAAVAFIKITGNRFWGNPNSLFQNAVDSGGGFFRVDVDDWQSLDGMSTQRNDNRFRRYDVVFTKFELETPVTMTAPAAGGAAALPATPAGYVTVTLGGAERKLPYY